MIRTIIERPRVEILNPNFTRNIDGVLLDELKSNLIGSLISNYKIVDLNITRRGLVMPSLNKKVIAEVDIELELTILILPLYCLLPRCKLVGKSTIPNTENVLYKFSVVNDSIPQEYLNSITIFVSINGANADMIKKLKDMETGDEIELFIINSTANPYDKTLKGQAITNFDERFTPVFKFNKSILDKIKSMIYGEPKPDANYVIKNNKLVIDTKNTNTPIDFLQEDELVDYIERLTIL